MKPSRILVVGLGSIGQRHARLLSERPDVETHLCDAVPANLEQAVSSMKSTPGGTYADYTAALSCKPDLVFICTPNHTHVSMGLQAIEAGVDVFVEKPISDNMLEARKLVDTAKESGRFLQVGYMLRFDAGLQKMKQAIDADAIGQLVGGRAMIGTYITLLNAKSPDRDKRPNSLIVDYTHELDFIRWFFGEAKEVQALGSVVGDLDMRPPPNIFQMNLKMQTGALVQVHMDYVQYPQRRIFEVYGDRGTLEYDFMTGRIKHFTYGSDHKWADLDVTPLGERVDDLYRHEHESVITSRKNGSPPSVSGEAGLAALDLAEAVIKAAEQKANVLISSED